ncbi:hypothetical protein [Azomonas macrocytogenes]|uniref:Uncharacterized protein n=1 Tax=Azomonas macrocytogenes TaxID=69962 RepID=A0A839T301_AZOMA|nr:hypothetical protein [Azomonas macrocytogenes]MBB3103379.1 hypothetical protein [Azomonas macrocytogenes]
MKKLEIPKITPKSQQAWLKELMLAFFVLLLALPFCFVLYETMGMSPAMTLPTIMIGWGFVRTSTRVFED